MLPADQLLRFGRENLAKQLQLLGMLPDVGPRQLGDLANLECIRRPGDFHQVQQLHAPAVLAVFLVGGCALRCLCNVCEY